MMEQSNSGRVFVVLCRAATGKASVKQKQQGGSQAAKSDWELMGWMEQHWAVLGAPCSLPSVPSEIRAQLSFQP